MMKTQILITVAALAVGAAGFAQDNKNKTWTDPEKAKAEDPDFSIQGEYGKDEEGQAWGLQVIAMGGGAFDAYLLEGGLPGLGWTKEKQRIKLTGKTGDAATDLASGDGKINVVIAGGSAQLKVDGEEAKSLPRIERKSPTIGAKPPEGAIVLFDGSNADEWKNGKVENGLLPNTNITTHKTFGSYTLHLEVRTPYKPFARGQGRGNSGVYHQGRFETQVLDSFGLEGKMNELGGIYSIAEPKLNMAFPPLTWQTYDVDFTAAKFDGDKLVENPRITVRLNGVVIHDNQELPKSTTASPLKGITPEPGPIYIQHHGNPVYYRNIWILPRD